MDNQSPPPPPTVGKEEDASLLVVKNSLIVSEIFAFLPFEELKKVRCVSSVWNEEGINSLKKRGLINFSLDEEDRGFVETEDFATFFESCQLMGKCGGNKSIQNWKITIPTFHSYHSRSFSRHTTGDKLYQDLHYFLHRNFELVKWINVLHLNVDIQWGPDFQILFNVLEEIQPTIQDLELSGYFGVDKGEKYLCQVDFSFPKLQKFSCRLFVAWDGWDEVDDKVISMDNWWNSIILGTRGVTTLIIGSGFRKGFVLERLSAFLNLEVIEFEETLVKVIKKALTQEQLGKVKMIRGVEED